MRSLSLAGTHFRLAARQRALWIVSFALALLSITITVNPGLSFETDNPTALALTAQMLALLPPIAYAAAFTDLAAEAERLGISEIEASAPVLSFELVAARVAGSLAAMALPSAGVLLFCAGGQMLHGNAWAMPQAAFSGRARSAPRRAGRRPAAPRARTAPPVRHDKAHSGRGVRVRRDCRRHGSVAGAEQWPERERGDCRGGCTFVRYCGLCRRYGRDHCAAGQQNRV